MKHRLIIHLAASLVALALSPRIFAAPPGPLHVSPENPRYFAPPEGRPILLAGAHDGWELQDYAWGDANAPVRFEWDAFLDFLVDHNLNVIRLWCVESTKINDDDDHPYHVANNVNGLDGDVDADGQGKELHTWLGPDHSVTQRQRAYVRKVVDTVGHFDHVLYEISNESHNESIPWQSKMVEYLRRLEHNRGKLHPIGMSVTFGDKSGIDLNKLLFESPADWIAPNRFGSNGYSYRDNPPPADGTKVILSDTDHFFGNSGKDHGWPWKTVCRGLNPLYMDMWTVERDDPDRKLLRRSLGKARLYTEKMNLAASLPRGDLASSRFCLAEPGRSYLVYVPNGGSVELDLTEAPGRYRAEWYNPLEDKMVADADLEGGGRRRLKVPFSGDAVLFAKRIEAEWPCVIPGNMVPRWSSPVSFPRRRESSGVCRVPGFRVSYFGFGCGRRPR